MAGKGPETTDDLSVQFRAAIDQKFSEGVPRPGWRAHEQELPVTAESSFELCPDADGIKLERPVPGEEAAAAARWKEFGGHRVVAYGSLPNMEYSLETVFWINGGKISLRRTVNYDPSAGVSYVSPPEQRALEDPEAAALVTWIGSLVPKQVE